MKQYTWLYETEPEPHLGGRKIIAPRGKVTGGSSSINGMIYVRGHAMDYDGWVEAGADGWGYADVLPYFSAWKTGTAVLQISAAGMGRCTSAKCPKKTRSITHLSSWRAGRF
jgi:choline dehydrogenase